MINRAYKLAKEKHEGQVYGDKPYIYHLLAVEQKCVEMYRVELSESDMDLVQAIALNHDIIEDTNTTVTELCVTVGVNVAISVEKLTKVDGESYKDYIKKVKSDNLALKVKIADTLCNLEESIKTSDMKRIKKYTKQLELLCKD